jgi:hypothetical protein
MMKRAIVASLVYTFLMASFVLATPACGDSDDNQLLLKISSSSNAHGEEFDQTNYNSQICFDNFFQNDYAGGNYHICDGNEVLSLSSATNAHSEDPAFGAYNVPVCYGDLTCEIKPTSESCQTVGNSERDGARIIFLSDQTDAHLAKNVLYPYQICCVSESVDPICNYDGECEGGEGIENCEDCNDQQNLCGNGVIDPGEECDGDETGSGTCQSEGYIGGNLDCNPDCSYDKRDCYGGGGGGLDECTYDPWIFLGNGDNGCEDGAWCDIVTCNDYMKLETGHNGFPGEDIRQDACNSDCGVVGYNWEENGLDAAPLYSGCEWVDNKCQFWWFGYENNRCETEVLSEESCTGNMISRTITIISTGGPDCDCGNGPGEICDVTVPCTKKIKLPFFDGRGIIFSMVIVMLIYIYLTKRE